MICEKIQLYFIVLFYCVYFMLLYYTMFYLILFISEGSLEVKRPTIWKDGKAEVGRVREEKKRSEKIREEKE